MLRKKSVKILGFETATAGCSVALHTGSEILERFELAPQRHAELILPMIDGLLTVAGMSLSQLDAIAVGRGPGSFMGVRIAVGVAQGLAFGADLPVIPISTLQILAQTAYHKYGCNKVIAGWDARMNAIYWGAYVLSEENKMVCYQRDALNDPQDVVLPEGDHWALVGNAWQTYQSQLSFAVAGLSTFTDIYPCSKALIELAWSEYMAGKTCSPFELEPVYLRDQVTHSKPGGRRDQ